MAKMNGVSDRLRMGDDPVGGKWLAAVDGSICVWTDTSNLATGVVVTANGCVIEDAAWLRRESDTTHINIRELDAAIRGVNLAVKWNFKSFTLKT